MDLLDGIDSAAHLGAIEEIGSTIAVLGHGFMYKYPKNNEELYDKIIEQNGCIITEYENIVRPWLGNFPKRDRLISGLSMGILIIEAVSKSGSMITANLAKKQKKKIFCVPSNIGIKQGEGTNLLIRKGDATLVTNVEDILKEYKIKKNESKKPNFEKTGINKEYQPVYKVISNNPININEICVKTKLDIAKVNYILTMLEIDDLIKELPGKEFIIK